MLAWSSLSQEEKVVWYFYMLEEDDCYEKPFVSNNQWKGASICKITRDLDQE